MSDWFVLSSFHIIRVPGGNEQFSGAAFSLGLKRELLAANVDSLQDPVWRALQRLKWHHGLSRAQLWAPAMGNQRFCPSK